MHRLSEGRIKPNDIMKKISPVARLRGTYGFDKLDRLFRNDFYFWPQTIERWKK